MSCCCFQVDIIVTCTGTNNDFQLFSGIKNISIYFVTSNNHCINIFHCIQKLLLFSIFLKQYEFVACLFHFFSNAINSSGCKWFLGSY